MLEFISDLFFEAGQMAQARDVQTSSGLVNLVIFVCVEFKYSQEYVVIVHSCKWSDVPKGTFYTDETNIISHVYEPGLRYAGRYIRDTGSFSSNVYYQMGAELLEFLLRDDDNHMTLICSMNIRPEDINALYDSSNEISPEDARNYLTLELNKHIESGEKLSSPVKMLVSLIASKKLSLVINLRAQIISSTDHSHSKSGIFEIPSTGEVLYFTGTVNETFPALEPELEKGNAESYQVYVKESIHSEYDLYISPTYDRLKKSAEAEGATEIAKGTISVPMKFLNRSDFPTMKEGDWDAESHKKEAAARSKKAFDKFQDLIDERLISGRPKDRSPGPPLSPPVPTITAKEMTGNREHQSEALKNWAANGRRGILKHATGSGKTITAIAAIEEHLAKSGENFSILVVPYEALQDQWNGELEKFGIRSINLGGDSNPKLAELVLKQINTGAFNENCVLNFVQNTFTQEAMVSAIVNGGEPLLERCLLVFDECHHVGRPSYRRFSQVGIHFPSVMGLSATPFSPIDQDEEIRDNWWEEQETSKFQLKALARNEQVRGLLGEVVDTFTLKQAIDMEYLTPYEYQIYDAEMTKQEQKDYDDYRSKIGKMMHLEENFAIHMSRAIVKSISGKIGILEDIVRENYKEGQYWLIYCSNDEFMSSAKEVLRKLDLEWWEYTSHNKESRNLHMDLFERDGGLMLAVKCLDEGVDIPKITHGIILSSSTVEREFVQRRGRMLRAAPGKSKAVIYDAVTIPNISASSKSVESIMKHEISRMGHFAEDADNPEELEIKLRFLNETFDIRTKYARRRE